MTTLDDDPTVCARRAAVAAILAACVLSAACAGAASESLAEKTPDRPAKLFTDVAGEAGVAIPHHKPVLDAKLDNIGPWMSSVGAAVAAGDFDGDGFIDLYVTDSHKGTLNHLYRNNGNGTFTDVAERAGVAAVNGDDGVSMDSIWADFDNDGRVDLYLVRWGRDALFHNQGDGTFRDVTTERFRRRDGSPGMEWANGNAAIALDYDLDGRLDIYVGNYFREVDLWHLETTWVMHDSFEQARNAGRNFLFRQNADGTFTDVAGELGVDDPGWTLAVGSADMNNDGWPDLYCANDFGPDQLFLNDGRGGFVNVTDSAIGRDTRKGMNVDFGDFNNDGWIDIYVTNITTAEYLREGNMLWRNNGPRPDGTIAYMDISPESGTYDGGWGWGGKFVDYDNDGDLDIFTVNGFISAGEGNYWYDLASWTVLEEDAADSRNWPTIGDRSFSGHETERLFRNDGFETFTRVDAEVGIETDRDGRGIACVDYDNDGDVDLFVANQGQVPHLFRNDLGRENHWLGVKLIVDPSTGVNADGIGTRVTVNTDGGTQYRERDGGNGFSGQSDPRLHFGLGRHERARLLEVRWPDGGLQYLEDVPADQLVTVRQEPEHYVASPLLAVGLPTMREAAASAEPQVPDIGPEELEALLSGLEDQLRRKGAGHALASIYRRKCAEQGVHDRAVAFFADRVERAPNDAWARLELSVAHVDKIPTCGGMAAIVCKGTQARRSLDQLDALLELHGERWEFYYGRGMNHLHWPRALRHTDQAIADFGQALRMQEAERRETGRTRPYHERVHVLLGDAYAKNDAFDDARATWQRGLEIFPASEELRTRLALPDDAAIAAYVAERRSLEQPIDTDFSFLDAKP